MQDLPIKGPDNSISNFDNRLSILNILIERLEETNEELYFQFMCGKQALIDNRYEYALERFSYVIEYYQQNNKNRFGFKNGFIVPIDEYVNSHFLRANTFFSLKNYEKAIDDYHFVLSLDKSNIGSLRNIAICYMNLEQFDLAIDYLLSIVKGQTFVPEELRYLGYCFYHLNKISEAHSFFKRSAEMGDKESLKILENNE